MEALDPRTLGQLLLIQSLAAQLPNQATLFQFAARGLEALPGIRRVWFTPKAPEEGARAFEIRHDGTRHATLCFQVADEAAFEPYVPYIQNLAFMLGIMLDERAQREENLRYRTQLESLVEARTRALRDSEARLRTFIDQSPVALLILKEGRCLGCNTAALALYHVAAPEDLIGRTPMDFAPERQPDGRPSAEAARHYLDLAERESFVKFQWECLLPDGATVLMEVSLGYLRIQGEPLIQCAAVDITEHRRILEEKVAFQARLAHVQKMESLGSLAGGVAHDMNNVLGAILGLASAHLEVQPPASPAHRAFHTIAQAATRGGKLVQSLLTFARTSPAEEKEVDLNGLLLEEIQLLERTTLARITLVKDLAPDLPAIRGDANALAHAFMNLCVNAVDAMGESGTLTIRTRRLDSGRVEVALEDTGCGMPREVLDRALDPFFTTKPVGKGTGLGLSIVYSTLQAHGGQVEIRSEPGRGTCVYLLFPISQGRPALPEPEPLVPAPLRRALDLLLVDDDPLIQESVAAILEAMGHRVGVARDGEEALRRLEGGERPSLVILDMNMPGLGGTQTLAGLRHLLPEVPVLVSTGRTDQATLDLVARHSGVALLSKPYTMEDLRRAIAALAN